jgi:hypothetical protein
MLRKELGHLPFLKIGDGGVETLETHQNMGNLGNIMAEWLIVY